MATVFQTATKSHIFITYIMPASVSVVLPSSASPAVALGGGNFGGVSGTSSPRAWRRSLSSADTNGSFSVPV